MATPSEAWLSASCCRLRPAVRPLTAVHVLCSKEPADSSGADAGAGDAAVAAAAACGAAGTIQPRGAGNALPPAGAAASLSRSPRRNSDRPPLRCALLLLLRACGQAGLWLWD